MQNTKRVITIRCPQCPIGSNELAELITDPAVTMGIATTLVTITGLIHAARYPGHTAMAIDEKNAVDNQLLLATAPLPKQ